MTLWDWSIVGGYLLGLLALGRFLGRQQVSVEDYYLSGRRLRWWSAGISTMATQLGAVSFISAPAFVALRPGGGLVWLGYEFAVPLALVFLMIVVLPVYHRNRVFSIYEYLERRFDASTRTVVSLVFQVSRSMASGVTIFALAIVLSATLGIPLWATILMTGLVTVLYDAWGGMKAVVYTDILQMAILGFGIIICGLEAYRFIGGWDDLWSALPRERLEAIRWTAHGWGDGEDFGFWPLVIGGFFLYASYYGCDQSQMQREISVGHLDEGRRSLLLNGIARFPLVLAYCLMGLLIGVYASQHTEFAARIPRDRVDYLVPLFIVHALPPGVTGLILIAILAAAMSSLDSALNSLSAATLRDVYQRYVNPRATDRELLRWSKRFTVMWGIACIGFAFLAGRLSGTVIEAINKIGSVFYGPILAAFLLGMLTRRTSGIGAKLGVLAGVATNLGLWLGYPRVSWLWWNALGCLVAVVVGYGVSLWHPAKSVPPETLWRPDFDLGQKVGGASPVERGNRTSSTNWRLRYLGLVFYTLFMIGIAVGLASLA